MVALENGHTKVCTYYLPPLMCTPPPSSIIHPINITSPFYIDPINTTPLDVLLGLGGCASG